MAATHTPPTPATTTGLTEDAFMADRLSFWDNFTAFTTKTTVAIILFCAWLWWCAFAGFSLLHVLVLPIVVGAAVFAL